MPFHDIKALREHLWYLDYPRQLSIESFRNPNFPLVAEMLQWFASRYNDNPDLPTLCDDERERTLFITSHVEFLFKESGIKMNPRRLYAADNRCVTELLRVASTLRKAMEAAKNYNPDEDTSVTGFTPPSTQELTKLMADQKKVREMASDLTARGARLYSLLGQEVDLREQRDLALSKELDMREIEQGMKRCIQTLSNQIDTKQKMIDDLATDEGDLQAKLLRKKEELKRANKRMKALKNVRPAFMDEYEKLEASLKEFYVIYVSKFRNLKYLESKVADIDKEETEKYMERARELQAIQEEAFSQQQERMLAGVGGDDLGDEFEDDDEDEDDDDDDDDEEEDDDDDLEGEDEESSDLQLGDGEDDELNAQESLEIPDYGDGDPSDDEF